MAAILQSTPILAVQAILALPCRTPGFRFCPRLLDFPNRRFAAFETDVIKAHWDNIVRLVASLKAGTVQPPIMLRKLAAHERQNQLDLAL